jgi:hypothetical protein
VQLLGVRVCLPECLLTSEAGRTGVAVLAGPNLGEALGGDALLVEGAEAAVAAVELALPAALEAVVVVELVLVDHALLLRLLRSILAAAVIGRSALDEWPDDLGFAGWLNIHPK